MSNPTPPPFRCEKCGRSYFDPPKICNGCNGTIVPSPNYRAQSMEPAKWSPESVLQHPIVIIKNAEDMNAKLIALVEWAQASGCPAEIIEDFEVRRSDGSLSVAESSAPLAPVINDPRTAAMLEVAIDALLIEAGGDQFAIGQSVIIGNLEVNRLSLDWYVVSRDSPTDPDLWEVLSLKDSWIESCGQPIEGTNHGSARAAIEAALREAVKGRGDGTSGN